MVFVERGRCCRSIERHAVHRDRIVGGGCGPASCSGRPARNHEILAEDLEPAHLGPGLDDLRVMRRSQPEPENRAKRAATSTLPAPPALFRRLLGFLRTPRGFISTKPWPLAGVLALAGILRRRAVALAFAAVDTLAMNLGLFLGRQNRRRVSHREQTCRPPPRSRHRSISSCPTRSWSSSCFPSPFVMCRR